MSGLEIAAAGAQAAGTLLGAYGEYSSGMDQAAAIDASRPYDIINATNKAQGLKYAADTSLAGAQRQAQARAQDKELVLSKSRAQAAAGGGGSDTSVINQEALIEQQGEWNKAVQLFGGFDEFNQLNNASQNALLEGVNTYNAKGVQASRMRSASKLQAAGTLLQGAGSAMDRYNRTRLPTFDKEISLSEARLRGAAVEAEYSRRELERENARFRRRSSRAPWGLGGGRYSSIYDWED